MHSTRKKPRPEAGTTTDANGHTVAYSLHGNRYLNITSRCTLRCRFCPKFNGSWDVQSYNLRLRGQPSVAEIVAATGDPANFREIVFCGLGEPTLRFNTLLEAAETLKAQGAYIRLNTDGLASLVQKRDVSAELAGRIDALSISLNAQNEDLYNEHCRPRLPHAWPALLDFTRRARPHVPDITLTAIDGLAGVDIDACRAIANELGVDFRRRVLDQVG